MENNLQQHLLDLARALSLIRRQFTDPEHRVLLLMAQTQILAVATDMELADVA
jgi:hypothetical protein